MPPRPPRPVLLLVALVVAVAAPVAVALGTGLADRSAGEQVETASDGGAAGGGRHEADDAAADTSGAPGGEVHLVGDGPGMTNASPTTAAPTTSPTTEAPAPTTTVAPPPPPPTTAPPTTAPPAPAPPPPGPSDQVVALVNAARADAGCPAVQVDVRLVAAAQAHSDDMAANDYFSHDSLDGRTFADRIRDAGYPDPGGENIAQGQDSAQAVHDAWMNSSGHRANILNCDFTTIGVGLHQASWTWTQDFGY